MLSISTIASAIADASISTDPSQLAAMIMELSKRSRARNQAASTGPVGPAVSNIEEHVRPFLVLFVVTKVRLLIIICSFYAKKISLQQ